MNETPKKPLTVRQFTDLEMAVFYEKKSSKLETELAEARAEIERKNEELDMFLAEQQAMNAEMYVLKVWKSHFEEMGLHEDSVTYKIICAALEAAERGE